MDILIDDNYRLHDIDSMNWELEEYRETTKRDTKEKVMAWKGTGHYFQNVQSAVEYAIVSGMHSKDENLNLREYVDELTKVCEKIKQFISENIMEEQK